MRKMLLFLLCLPLYALSQSLPTIEEKTKNLVREAGFINFYWDANAGKIYMEIPKLEIELLYQSSLPAGLGSNDVGLDRGLLGKTAIIKFSVVGNKVLMVQPNYSYRASTTDEAEKRAVEQSFATSTLWGFAVDAASKNAVLVDATAFLMSDVMQVSNRLANSRQGSYGIDLTRSAMYMPRTKNFPFNTEFESSVTFTSRDARPGAMVASVAPSADAITVRMHHSFIRLPDNKYKPRVFDPRSGAISTSYFDYSTPVSEPIEKHFIIRHRLQKKDATAAKSEAVKPIIYYLDNGTPEPIRTALLEGAQWWNEAFETAGFTNAFQVKILPGDADPMDVRYNMINWVHRSTRGWSYGASVTDPRTGEILKGNVTLGSLRVRQDYLIAQGLLAPYESGIPVDDKMLKMALQRLRQLSAHEVGHTLGLMHNYIASTQGRASVMDYPSPVVSLDAAGKPDLGNAYTNAIGEWDKVAINYAYADMPPGADEKVSLDNIITSAAKKGLSFISDRDARDQGGMHPSAHLWDEAPNTISGLKNVMKVREKSLAQFGEHNIRMGAPMAFLEDALVPIYLYHRYQVEAVSKLVGGMNYSYALKGDGQLVTEPLAKDEQLRALNAVVDCIEPNFLALPARIIRLIPPRPAGYAYTRELFGRRTSPAFDPLSAAESAADLPLSLLFHPARINRMVENKALYNGLGADDMINLVMDRTWRAPRSSGFNGLIQQQNEQLLLGYLLQLSVTEELSFGARAVIFKAIDDIDQLSRRQLSTTPNNGSGLLTLDRIKNRLEAKPFVPQAIPPGAPIGCDED